RNADLRADEATDARLVADANRLAAVAANARPLDLSLLLAAAAVQLAPTPSTQDGLLAALLTHRRAVAVHPISTYVNETALGRDGETMIMNVGGGERHVALWEVGSPDAPRWIDDLWPDTLAASPDGRLLVAAAGSSGEPTIRVYRPDGERVLYLQGLADTAGWPRGIAFTDEGRLLVVYATPGSEGSGWRAVLAEVDLDTGRVVPLHRLLRSESPDLWFTADFNEDASELVVWTVQDQSLATRYDVRTGAAVPLKLVRRAATSVDFIALRDETVQTWSDGAVTRYDASGNAVQELAGHTALVRDVVEVRGGRGVATVGEGGQAQLWDVDRRSGRWTQAEPLAGHSGHIEQAEVLHDG
ncbi:MAG: WD40 repeat domain-containing protein, partial [Nocardioidaceae bacterium]